MRKISEIKSRAWDMLFEKKWFGPIIVCLFTVLLSTMINFASMFFETNNIILTLGITLILSVCIITPFSMGAKIYMLEFVRGSEVTVGNVFDGFQFAIKLIPLSLINIASSYLLVFGAELLFAENLFFSLLGATTGIVYLLINVILNFSMYLIYDNDGKIIKSIKDMTVYMLLKGGIIKLIMLILSYILWFFGIIISFGLLTFFVLPYMEAARAVFYDDIYTFIRSGN